MMEDFAPLVTSSHRQYRHADRSRSHARMSTELAESGSMQASRQASRFALFDALLSQSPELAEQAERVIKAQLPRYRAVPRQLLAGQVALYTNRLLRAARDGRPTVTDREVDELAAFVETRARQGIPADDVLRGWRIGFDVVAGCARQVAKQLDIDDAQVLACVQLMASWLDGATAAATGAHRSTDFELSLPQRGNRAMFVRGALFGDVPVVELHSQAQTFGLDPYGEYVAVRARLDRGTPSNKLERMLGFHDGARSSTVVDGYIVGFLPEPPPRRIDAVVGFGPAMPMERLVESHRLAERAVTAVEACRLRGAYDIASLGLRAAVAVDADVGELLCHRYLEPLAQGGSARELVATLRAYLACGMNVERTATRLFVHQNTVRYRLNRFEELTGASLHEPEDLFGVWWALEFSATRATR
jgi:hypothetical protein